MSLYVAPMGRRAELTEWGEYVWRQTWGSWRRWEVVVRIDPAHAPELGDFTGDVFLLLYSPPTGDVARATFRVYRKTSEEAVSRALEALADARIPARLISCERRRMFKVEF